MRPEKINRLKEIILRWSYEKSPVVLASGRKSEFYFDGKQTTLHPEGLQIIAEWMGEILQRHFPEAQGVGGPTLGADPLVAAVGLLSWQRGFPIKTFIVRKTAKGHGTKNWIEGVKHLKPGMRVVLLEDVLTTGGSLLKACQRVREGGLVPVGAMVLVDREEGGRENLEAGGLKLFSLFTRSELLKS